MVERTTQKKRRADLILIGALLLIAGVLTLWRFSAREQGARAVVYVNGAVTASYPLEQDTVVRLETSDGASFNELVIENGQADVVDAGCPDKLCVHMRPIRYSGESIICLPNRTEIRIEGGMPSGVDIG